MRDFNVEYCHTYADQLAKGDLASLRPGITAAREVIETLQRAGKTYTLNVLIDDYFEPDCAFDPLRLREFLAGEGLEPDGVYLEGDMRTTCEEFLANLRESSIDRNPIEIAFACGSTDVHLHRPMSSNTLKGGFLRGRRVQLDSGSDDGNDMANERLRCQRSARTVLAQYKDDGTRYSCPLLATCWTLARMGVDPYYHALTTFSSDAAREDFVGRETITVVPTLYLNVESTVLELIGNLRSKALRKLQRRVHYRLYPW